MVCCRIQDVYSRGATSWIHPAVQPSACSESISCSETSTGSVRASSSSAHTFSLYGVIAGQSSVSASRMRAVACIWLSATWWTVWRTVQPPSRYGVSIWDSERPAAARSFFGSSAISRMALSRSCGEAARVAQVSNGMAQIIIHALHATMDHGRRARKSNRATALNEQLQCVFPGWAESKRENRIRWVLRR